VGVLVTLVILAAALLMATRVVGVLRKVGLAKEMITSYMGVIVFAMGVQFALKGIKGFFLSLDFNPHLWLRTRRGSADPGLFF
jgi:multiple antibiotic resistance protein